MSRSARLPLSFLLVFFLALLSTSTVQGVEMQLEDAQQEKAQAIDRLFDKGGTEAAKGILPFLKDRELVVRSHAMKRLVDLGPASVDALIGALDSEEMRWLASGALINIGNESVRKTVLALKHKNPVVRRNALFILRQLDARAAAPSIQAALNDTDPSVQIQAIQTVAQFGGEGGLRLVMAKVDSTYPSVRDAAIESLPKFGEGAIAALTSLLSYGNVDVRVGAIRALGAMGTKEALLYLRKILSDPSPLVRYYACLTLGETGDPSILEDVASYLDDKDPNVREAATEAFARMPDAGRPILFRLLRDGNPLQKISAATSIRKCKYRAAMPILLEVLRDPSPDVRVSAVAALMVIADPASVEGLVNGLRDPEIRWICIMALRQFGDANLRPLLRRSNDPELDYWKQYVLEGMGDRVLEGCLESLKKEEDIGIRIASLCTMRQIKDTRAIYPLIRLLADERVGFVASFVLSQMGEVVVEPLLLSLQDENPAVRARAAVALGEIGFTRVVRPLRDLLADKDPQVRKAAEDAIRKIGGVPGEPSPAPKAPVEPCPP
ncbi:MAG: HEAT repeat domain-containing protein [Candidatus Deferrimicrobiota bacterium]